jgi:hypothetical protein
MEAQFLEPTLLHLSQAHLNLLEICPPQFQRIYLDQLASPLSPEQQEKLNWGNQFHRLMQQQQLGLPIDPLLAKDEQLQQAISALIKIRPDRGKSGKTIWQEAEHCRTLRLDNYLLTVIYDLLLIESNRAEIFDWKTYLQPENSEKLSNNWQTRLYLYVLTETSDFLPEQISLTYWFVKVPRVPQSLTFKYSRKQHKKNKKDLTHLLSRLDHWRSSDLAADEIPFPHVPNCQENCPYYTSLFSGLKVNRSNELGDVNNWQQFVDTIQEIVIE